MSGIYIHIPFCASKCIYCGFYSTTGKEALRTKYIDTILEEYKLRQGYIKNNEIDTIYIGGGTPSTLSHHELRTLANGLPRCKSEFTIECNPDDVTPDFAEMLTDIGVNRVSMGAQTSSDSRLKFLNRRHKASMVPNAIKNLRAAGIKNISIDLMFGFPDESIADWQNDIECALSMNVEHISAYSLMYEEGTPLYQLLNKGSIKESNEDTCAEMYELLIEELTKAGYEHYEISNFAKPGYRSIHNSNYWNGTPYIGLGAAAHSYDGMSRQWNVSDIDEYIKKISTGIIPMEREEITPDTRYNDIITTALRTKEGINLNILDDKYHIYVLRSARKALDAGLLCIEKNHLHLTHKGLYVSDNVMSDLIWV